MIKEKPTTAELKKLAEDALALACSATEGPWMYWEVSEEERFSVDSEHLSRYIARKVWDGPDAALMAASRQLVPDLATALLATLDLDRVKDAEIERLKAKYEGPFVPIKKAKAGDILGYSKVVYTGRGKPLRQQLSPEELEDLATEE